MSPGRGGAQPYEGKHRGDDEVVLGVALLLVKVELRVEEVDGQTVQMNVSKNQRENKKYFSTHVAEQ